MRYRLLALPLLLMALVAAPAATPAMQDVGATVTVTSLGGNSFNLMVQNTDTLTFVTSFTFVPGPGLTVGSVTGNDIAANCAISGSGIACTAFQLAAYQCECHPGGIINVTFTGAYTGSGAPTGSLSQLGTAPAFGAGTGPSKTGTTTGSTTGATTGTTTAATAVTVLAGKPSATGCKLSVSKVKQGTVTFKVKNTDTSGMTHNFTINGKTTKPIAKGASQSLTVKFSKSGKYGYSCTAPGHSGTSLKGTLTVT